MAGDFSVSRGPPAPIQTLSFHRLLNWTHLRFPSGCLEADPKARVTLVVVARDAGFASHLTVVQSQLRLRPVRSTQVALGFLGNVG